MMSIALLLRRSLRPLTLSGVIESTVSTKQASTTQHQTCNYQQGWLLNDTHRDTTFIFIYCYLYKLCLPNFKKISITVQYGTPILTLTSIQLEFWSPFHRQELHVFVIVVQKVLLLHLPHTFPEPGGRQVSHQINALYGITVQSSTGWVTSCPRQPYNTLTTC